MNKSLLQSASRNARRTWVGVLLLTVGLAALSGCDSSTSVRQTFPADGEDDVRENTQVLIRFDTAFKATDDTSSEYLAEHIQIRGDMTPQPYAGTYTIQPFSTALSSARSGGDPDSQEPPVFTDPDDVEEVEEPDTVVFTLASSEGFKQGETITVSVSHDLKIAGSFIQSHQFSFHVLVPLPTQGDLGTLRVIATDPRNHRILGTDRPRMAAKFSDPVAPGNLAASVSVRGEISGRHPDLEVLFTELSGTNVLEAAARLGVDDSLIPGEWVTVTFSDEIRSASGGDSAAHLSPYSFRFQVSGGALDLELDGGPWAGVLNRTTGVRARRLAAGNLIPQSSTLELCVLGDAGTSRRIELHALEADQWVRRDTLTFPIDGDAFPTLAGMVIADLVSSDDFEPDGQMDLAVVVEGSSGSQIRFYNFTGDQRLEEISSDLRVDFPATGIGRLYAVDLDSNGHLDLVVTHASRNYTPPAPADTADPTGTLTGLLGNTTNGPISTGFLTVLQKRLTQPDLTNIDLTNPDSLLPSLAFELVVNPLLLARRPVSLAFGDLDGDGKLDVVSRSAVGIHIHRNAGTRDEKFAFQFAREIAAPVAGNPRWSPDTWALADLDADRDLDLIGWTGTRAHVLVNTVFPLPDTQEARDEPRGIIFEDLTLERLSSLDLPRSAASVRMPEPRDLDGDGILDLLVPDVEGDFHLFLGQAAGDDEPPFQYERFLPAGTASTFASIESSAPGNLFEAVVADLDGDRGLDLALVTLPIDDSLFQNSSLETLQTREVGEITGSGQRFALGICGSDAEPRFPIECVEPVVLAYGGSRVRVPVVGTTRQDASGYTISIAYDDSLLDFEEFLLPPNLVSGAEISTCSPAGSGSSDCEGFVRIQVTLNATSQGRQTALSPGENVFLGDVIFRGREVSNSTSTLLSLVHDVVVADEETAGNLLVIPDGVASSREPVDIDLATVEVAVEPPLLQVEPCEVIEIRESDFVGEVRWDVADIPGVSIASFRVNVGGRLFTGIAPTARTFQFTRSGTGDFTVTVSALDASGQTLDSSSCSGGVDVQILRPQVLCVAQIDSNEISWSLSTPVDRFIVYKNGEAIRTLSGSAVDYIDRNPSEFGGDLYEVQGIRDLAGGGRLEGPRGVCAQGAIGDDDPDVTLAPAGLTLILRPRSLPTSPNVLELGWTNGEGYDAIDLDLLREGPAGMEVIESVSLLGSVFGHVFDGDTSAGVDPGRYRFRVVGTRGGVASEPVTSSTLSVQVPGLEDLAFSCSRSEADSVFLFWNSVWSGYSYLEVTASDSSDGEVLAREFLDPARRSHAFEALPFARSLEFAIRGVYQGYLPDSISREGAPRTCELTLEPALRLTELETGVGLERSIVIPIRANLPSRATGFTCNLELPDFIDLPLDPERPESLVLLNDSLVSSQARFDTLEVLPAGEGRQTLAIAVSGAEFTPGEDRIVAWVIGSVDWTVRGFELWGAHEMAFTGSSSLTFAPADLSEIPFTATGVATGDDARASLLVRKRYLAVEEVPVVASPSGEPEVVSVQVKGTFDNPSGNPDDTEGYRILSYTVRVRFDPSELELQPVTLEDQEVTVGFGEGILQFPTGDEFELARERGDVSLIWLGFDLGLNPEDTQLKFIGSGVNMPFAVFRFRPRVTGNVSGRNLTVEFVQEPETEASSVLTTRVPSDLDPVVSYFDGAVNVLPRAEAPVLSALAPTFGPITGGTEVTLTGLALDDEVVDPADLQVTFRRMNSLDQVTTLVVPGDDILERGPDQIRLRVPPAGEEFYVPTLPAVAFDVQVDTPGGSTRLDGAFTYENLFLSTLSRTEGAAAGGEPMFITGTGLGESATVSFRVGAGDSAPVFPVTEITRRDPTGRRLEFLTPALPVPGGSLATVVVEVPELGAREFSVPFRVLSQGVIRSLDPASGPITGGTEVTLLLGGFDSLAGAQVFLGDQEAAVLATEGETLRVEVPSVTEPGPVDVRVVAGGDDVVLTNGFTYLPVLDPQIIAIDPAQGGVAGGEVVTITLADFSFGTESFGVRFGEVQAETVVENSSGSIQVTVPPGLAAGTVDVEVRRGELVATLVDGYRYRDARINSVTPETGPVGGGTAVILEVQDFGGFTEAPTVTLDGLAAVVESFGGEPGSDVATIEILTPRHCSPGAVDVTVTAGSFSSTLTGGFTYDLTGVLDLLAVTAPDGLSGCGGDVVLIETSGICDSATVRLGGEVVPAENVTTVDEFTLRVLVDALPVEVDEVTVEVSLDGAVFVAWDTPIPVAPEFIRGDVDGSGQLDVTDSSLLATFLSGQPTTFVSYDALDVNDSGEIDAGDLTYLNVFLFLGGIEPPAPYPAPGVDPTPEDGLPRCVN